MAVWANRGTRTVGSGGTFTQNAWQIKQFPGMVAFFLYSSLASSGVYQAGFSSFTECVEVDGTGEKKTK